ncbi:MAG: alkaline phosphatase family protein, partial [Candidatus Delongbacteria bacterium]
MFYKPDYTGKSIVNLMGSISKCFDLDPVYRELNMLPSKKIKQYKNIVHIVIDGLGYNYLMKKRENFLKTHTIGKITSVFPSTTSACITSFATGLAPKEHGVTGWFVRIKNKNVDIPSTILLFNDRRDGELLTNKGIAPSDVFTRIRLSTKIRNLKSVLPSSNISSIYTHHMLSDSTKIGYDGLEDFFDKISESVRSSSDNQNYIYGYLPDFDSIMH